MFKNPSLNNLFDLFFDGFYIYSTQSEVEILLKEIANNLSKDCKILYISNDDTIGLDSDILYFNIFNDDVFKKIYKFKNIDFIFIENISFLSKVYKFPKHTKIIASGFLKSDLKHFKNLKTTIMRFYFTNDFMMLKNKKYKFKYNFDTKIIKTNNLFKPNKIDFDLDKEVEFYFLCLNQNFKFNTNRNSRYKEFLQIFENGNLICKNTKFIQDDDTKYFYINDKKINNSFIPNGIIIYKNDIKIVNYNGIKKINFLSKVVNFFKSFIKI